MSRRLVVLGVLAWLVAACGGDGSGSATVASGGRLPDDAFVIRASSDLSVGPERLLLALAAPDGSRLGSPDLEVTVAVYPEGDPDSRVTVPGTWMWAIPDRSGLYRVAVEFDRSGTWFAEVAVADRVLEPVPLFVQAAPATPAVGDPAPRSATPTGGEVAELAEISSDLDPAPALYELSVDEAVASGRPSVIVFATPRFCQTAVCAPTLDAVKEMRSEFPGVNFVHVEVYDLAASGDATSVQDLVVHPAVEEWGLPTEPWVFVVDRDGLVAGRFEGMVAPEELRALLG